MDTLIREIFQETKVFACVGASMNPARPSYYVSEFLMSHGYRVIPINPGTAGKQWLGETVYATLADVPKSITIDALDIFRRSDALPEIVRDAHATLPDLKYIWTQLGVINDEAADLASTFGYKMVQDRCPKIEIPRLVS
jgi:predicted CoA-binding protein